MIKLLHVNGGYQKKTVIQDISTCFLAHKLNVVIGPNGCGKSTLMRVASGIMQPQKGQVMLNGRLLSSLQRQDIAKAIAYLPQSRSMPNISVEMLVLHGRFPHLTYPRRYRQKDMDIAQEAMHQMNIKHMAKKQVTTLSGGERQKVYIAMMLAQNSDVVFMDEPTTYLDIGHQLEVMDILVNLRKINKTLVIILHDINMAMRYADQLFLMDQGKLVYEGDAKHLCKSHLLEDVFEVNTKQSYIDNIGIQYYFESRKVNK